jgi:hypothetical protein
VAAEQYPRDDGLYVGHTLRHGRCHFHKPLILSEKPSFSPSSSSLRDLPLLKSFLYETHILPSRIYLGCILMINSCPEVAHEEVHQHGSRVGHPRRKLAARNSLSGLPLGLHGYEDGRFSLPARFVTIFDASYLFSCGVHSWVELKACKKWCSTLIRTSCEPSVV